MKKWITTIALAFLASTAMADVNYYINPSTGSDSNAGTSPTTAWRSMQKANTSLPAANTANGNVYVHLYPGNYTVMPKPPSDAANGKRYFFYGDIANPGKVTMTGSDISNESYMSIRGVKFTSSFDLDSGTSRDSIMDCDWNNNAGLSIIDASYNYIGRCTIRKQTILVGWVDADDKVTYNTTSGKDTVEASASGGFAAADSGEYIFGRGLDPRALIIAKINDDSVQVDIAATSSQSATTGQLYPACVGNTFESCSFPNLGKGVGSSSGRPASFYGRGTDSLTVLRCDFQIVIEPNADNLNPSHFTRFFSTANDLWKYNHWSLFNNSDAYRYYGLHRDFSYNLTVVKDTIIAYGRSAVGISFSNSGSYPKSVGGQSFDSLWVVHAAPTLTGGAWGSTDRCQDLTFTNSFVMSTSGSGAWYAPDLFGRVHITNNTFVGFSGASIGGGVFDIVPDGSSTGKGITYSDTVTVKDNIFYSLTPGAPLDGTSIKYAASFDPDKFDSNCVVVAGVRNCPLLDTNNNIYAYYGFKNYRAGKFGEASGDRSIGHRASWFSLNASSAPGDSVTNNLSVWEGYYDAKDSLSLYNSPGFIDSIPTFDENLRAGTTFNPGLTAGSPAIGASSTGGDIGAVAYVAGPTIGASVSQIVFVPTGIGSSYDIVFNVRNDGASDLSVSSITPGITNVTCDRDTASIAPGDTRTVTATAVSVGLTTQFSQITVASDDAINPEIVIHLLVVTPDGNKIWDL